ncbi:MAG: hypothetical protein SGJ18_06285 [Pseudomonadota bacterium]|nr:hypothetical protein [Pseudomonadota bacterium]
MSGLLQSEEKLNILVNKIANLIQNNFDVGFKFLTIEQWDYIATNRILNDNDIYLPIKDEHHLLGVAQIIEGKVLDTDQVAQLDIFIDSIFSGALTMLSHIDDLEREETRIKETHSDQRSELSSNVVQISNYKQRREKTNTIEVKTAPEVPQGDLTVFVHATSHEQIFKIAHEIYTQTKRFAFLEISSFKENELAPEFLENLGNICLFIPEIINLSPRQSQVIEQYLLNHRTDPNEGVLIVSGSIHNSAELVRSLNIPLDFYRLVSQVRLSHMDLTLSQDQLALYAETVTKAHQDLLMIILLNQLGITSLGVDNPT